MRYISDEELMDIYKTELGIDPMVNILYLIEYRCKDLNPWLTMGEFYKLNFEGLCWIDLGYEINFAWYQDNNFRQSLMDFRCWNKDAIIKVLPIHKPSRDA